MSIREPELYELIQDGNDAYIAVGGCVVKSIFEAEAEASGHHDTLDKLIGVCASTSVELEFTADSNH